MSKSTTRQVSPYLNRITHAVAQLCGREITQAEILKAYAVAYPERRDDLQWIMGSDHSRNHTNNGACECAKTALALFERVDRGKYRVL